MRCKLQKRALNFLASTFSIILVEHMRGVLPAERLRLTLHLADVRRQLEILGPEFSSECEPAPMLFHRLTCYA